YLLHGTEIGVDWEDVREFARSLVLLEDGSDAVFAMPVDPGERFVKQFFRLDRKLYFDPVNKLVDVVTADAARELLNEDVVSEDEFWRMTDDEVWTAMHDHPASRQRIERFEDVLAENRYRWGAMTTAADNADVTVSFRSATIDPILLGERPFHLEGMGGVVPADDINPLSVDELLASRNVMYGHMLERASDFPGGEYHIEEQEWRGDTDFHFDLPGWDYDAVELA
ncbi:MAG: hypothetical protein ABEI97_01690, partial [Candidatus Nanohaloarchaea archaeon]